MHENEIIHRAIWERVPELRDALIAFKITSVRNDLETGIEPFVGPYALLSGVLFRPHLLPLIEDPDSDEAALLRCAQAIEQILGAENSFLTELIGIRISARLLNEPARWRRFRDYAGPRLKAEILNDSQYYPWPYDEPIV